MSNYSDPYDLLGVTEESLTELDPAVGIPGAEQNVTSESNEVVNNDVEVAGTESFVDKRIKILQELRCEEHPELASAVVLGKPRPPQLHILTNDNQTYRVYMRSDIWFSPKEINQLCRFLDTRTSNQTVIFLLGVDMPSEQSSLLGPIISSIISCKGNTVGLAMGLCSFPETMIWSYCKQRDVKRYGAVCYDKPEFIKTCKEYEHYYREAFKRGIEIGLITQEDVDKVFSENKEIMIMYNDYKQIQLS